MRFRPHHNAAFVAFLPAKGTLQEVVARAGHSEAAAGFALACAAHVRGAGACARPRVWVRQDAAIREVGDVYGLALSAFSGGAPAGRMAARSGSAGSEPARLAPQSFVPESGLPAGLLTAGLVSEDPVPADHVPEDLIIVRARTFIDTLRAGLEAVRCAALDVVFIETVAAVDLTASRRLKLAAQKSGVAAILLRHTPAPVSNAVSVRWQVGAAARCENGRRENCPEAAPARFDVELVKHPAGLAGTRWRVEWNNERQQFDCDAALPQSVDAIPVGRSLASPDSSPPDSPLHGKARRSA